MKTLIFVLALLIGGTSAPATTDTNPNPKTIALMKAALNNGGIREMLDAARDNNWNTPYIPSQWHVAHVSNAEQKPMDVSARELGKTLATVLNAAAPKIRDLSADETLYDQTSRLLDVSEWCASVEGYGNMLLAQRALDLAAVGVARLAANLNFSVDKVTALSGRLHPAWMSDDVDFRILNKDAGVAIFTTPDRDAMEHIYGSGRRLLDEQRNPRLYLERLQHPEQWKIVETDAIKANLSFFDAVDLSQERPVSLLKLWNSNWHMRIIEGLDLRSAQKAEALVEFRRAIGKFPDKPTFTAEQLQKTKQETAEAAKHGIKIVPFESAYSSPEAAAFAQAWKNYLDSNGTNVATLPPQRYNLDASAFEAYEEVERGAFLDIESQESQH